MINSNFASLDAIYLYFWRKIIRSWFSYSFGCWQQGEAKKALQVLQKPKVPIDLKVWTLIKRMASWELYDFPSVWTTNYPDFWSCATWCWLKILSLSFCSTNLHQILSCLMHMKLLNHGWSQKTWIQESWFLQWWDIQANLMQSNAPLFSVILIL